MRGGNARFSVPGTLVQSPPASRCSLRRGRLDRVTRVVVLVSVGSGFPSRPCSSFLWSSWRLVWATIGAIGDRHLASWSTHRLYRPCRARPADRSLVAEDRSAEGVRDQTGPDPRSVLGPQPNGEPRTTAGRSGHRTFGKTAGRSTYSLLTSGGAAGRSGVRVSPPPPLRPGRSPGPLRCPSAASKIPVQAGSRGGLTTAPGRLGAPRSWATPVV
jgi:hypothetical protein